MGRLGKPHLAEAAIWFTIVLVFFSSTFAFNQPIEIYRFGATGWPRVVLGLLLLATLGNLYYQYRHGSAVQSGQVGVTQDESPADYSDPSMLIKMIAVLLTPFIFAWLLKPVGIYSAAPVFIAAIIWLFGERRWRSILATTVLIYVIFMVMFVVLLNAPLPQGNMSPFYDISAFILKLNNTLQQLW